MEMPDLLYLTSLTFTFLVTFLFFRYIFWGIYARYKYWRKTVNLSIEQLKSDAEEKKMALPFFSILVPARDEADVIAPTIDHLVSLNYPKDHFEIVIITDQKELLKGRETGSSTTQLIVEKRIKEIEKKTGMPAIKHVIVPYDFDGRVGGGCSNKEVDSTKARALNFGLGYVHRESVICSFFDAESRPDPNVILYVAARYVATNGCQKIWQGPVFQVRNFYQLRPINKIIALYQALAHEWYFPILMRHLPFLGGTNLHIERQLLLRLGGYDFTSLSEDLELGVRAYLETGEWPEYLPVVSTEQTPPTYKGYFRQRLRWGSGHLLVYDKFRYATQYPESIRSPLLKVLFWKGQFQWYLYQTLVLAPFIFSIFSLFGELDPRNVPVEIQSALAKMAPLYFGFTFYLFYRYRKYINVALAPYGWRKYLAILHLIVMPIAGLFIALPFTTALLLRAIRKQPTVWIKTPRTREIHTVLSEQQP